MKDFQATTVKLTSMNALNVRALMAAVVSTVSIISLVIARRPVTKDTCVKSTLTNAVGTILASEDDASTHLEVTPVFARVKMIAADIVTRKILAESFHPTPM